MSVPQLKVGGIAVTLNDFPVSQSYEPLTGSQLQRMANGAAFKQEHWRKLKTTITGRGWLNPDLAGIDWSASVVIDCIAPRAIHSATTGATLPTARRSDAAPYAFAHVNGEKVATPCSVVGDAATATAVTGATGYSFNYFPSLTCYCDGPSPEQLDQQAGEFSWQLVAEEA